jgi:hypothetical protein
MLNAFGIMLITKWWGGLMAKAMVFRTKETKIQSHLLTYIM